MNRVVAVALAAILAAGYLLPFASHEVGDLIPVEILLLDRQGSQVLLYAEEGLTGRGQSVFGAVESLKNTAPGEVWLEQTRYILATPQAEELLAELKQAAGLRLGCRVYSWQGQETQRPEELTPLLAVQARREPGLTLGQVLNAQAGGLTWTLPKTAGGGTNGA